MSTKYHIAGEEVTIHQKIEHKLKQLSEALDVLEEVNGKVLWAADFAGYSIITDCMYDVLEITDNVSERLQEEKDSLELCLENYNEKKQEALQEAEEEFKQCVCKILQ